MAQTNHTTRSPGWIAALEGEEPARDRRQAQRNRIEQS